ncbi:hypothetical protein RHSIM_Rhsim03G0131000 [Rhododendron simsii]|uniref:Uncharacterized protein n=1 Tax=Rhododendron simsii TaxID=118357 RepID=A0A834H6G9_RHOSS|nr:hypothetical protein RHSIM_Rhsim03G0131000 [Rhododendron simsii]
MLLVGRVEVLVNRYEIVAALDYQRPATHEINYLRENFATPHDIAQGLYINPTEVEDPHVPGKFKPKYKLLNQFVHFNINPRGTENKPNEEEGELLFAFAEPEKTKLEPGVINSSNLIRSTSQSRALKTLPGETYLTSMPACSAPKPTWYKKLFCQGVSIIGSPRKDKKERQEMARRQARMDHRLEWLT